MKRNQRNERISFVAAGILLFSILMMIITIPFLFSDPSLTSTPISAAIGIVLALAIHLLIFRAYIKNIRDEESDSKKRARGYLWIGILLILFGAIYVNGAVSFLSQDGTPIVSIFMFTSTSCDLMASILIFILILLNRKK